MPTLNYNNISGFFYTISMKPKRKTWEKMKQDVDDFEVMMEYKNIRIF